MLPSSIRGKRILVLGSTGGLGKAITECLDEDGAELFLHGHGNAEVLVELASRLEHVSGTGFADLAHEEAVVKLLSQCAVCWDGQLDGMVVASGVNPTAAPIRSMELEDWNRTLAVNLTGVFLAVKHAIPMLKAAGGGKIVIISSIFGIESPSNRGAYGVSKHGLTGLVQTVCREEGGPPSPIQVNAICPGPAWGPNVFNIFKRHAKERGISIEEYTKERVQRIPAGRFVEPAEIAALARYLCSDASNYVNGQVIKLTGGAVE